MLRSIKKAYDIVRQQDAETAFTVHTIRMWCKEGKINVLPQVTRFWSKNCLSNLKKTF